MSIFDDHPYPGGGARGVSTNGGYIQRNSLGLNVPSIDPRTGQPFPPAPPNQAITEPGWATGGIRQPRPGDPGYVDRGGPPPIYDNGPYGPTSGGTMGDFIPGARVGGGTPNDPSRPAWLRPGLEAPAGGGFVTPGAFDGTTGGYQPSGGAEQSGGWNGPLRVGTPGGPQPGGSVIGQPGQQGGTGAGTGAPGNPQDRAYIIQQLTNVLQQHGIQPGPRGSGPGDVEYYADQVQQTGGWQGGNAGYWTNRLGSDIQGGGGRGGAGGGYTLSNPNDLTAGFTNQFQGISNVEDTPGYKFALQQGLHGIDTGAAAKGTLLTMGNQKDRASFASGLAQQTYGDEWNRAHQSYMDAFNIFNTNQNNLFNRNFSVAGLGLSAAGGQAGAAEGIGNNQASAYQQQGNATGASTIQQGNNNAQTATTIGNAASIFLPRYV